MPYVNVNIDLDEIDTDDLIKEIRHRWRWMDKKDKAELIDIVKTKPIEEIKIDYLPIVSDKNQLTIFQ